MSISWKQIKGFENVYEVSNTGLVRSIYRMDSLGRIQKLKVLKPKLTRFGYHEITLALNGKKQSQKIHRLVALAFIANHENKPQVNHIDGNKTNNHVSNLEWCTANENISHGISLGLINHVGSNNSSSKINEEHAKEIRLEYLKGSVSQRQLASKYNVSQKVIFNVVNQRSWNHV